MAFPTVFSNFRVLRDTFFEVCWHISEGFGVKKNDAVIRLALASAVRKLKNAYIISNGTKVNLLDVICKQELVLASWSTGVVCFT